MKKGITLLALAAATTMSANAAEMPKIYGKLNKAWTITDADKVEGMNKRGSSRGLTDVANSSSRLGVKGKVVHGNTTMKYKIELDMKSSGTDKGGKNGILRKAVIHAVTKNGTLTLGQTYSPFAKHARTVDPLSGTIAGFQGKDINNSIDNATKDSDQSPALGFEDRSRADVVAYTTPNIYGLTYNISTDRDNNGKNEYGSNPSTSIEQLAQYNRDMGKFNLGLFVGHRKTTASNVDTDTNLLYGTKLGFGKFGVNLAMSGAKKKTSSNGYEAETNRMFASFSYMMNDKHSFAVTHQTKEMKETETSTLDYTQTAFGYTHKCSKNISFSATYAMFETEASGSDYSASSDKKAAQAEASQMGVGITLKF